MPDDTSIELTFPRGLPGFEDQNRFILLQQEALAPILVLKSAAASELRFYAVSVWMVDSEYQIGISDDDLSVLKLERPLCRDEGVLCLAILSPAEGEGFTANLLAPVVVNTQNGIGVQAVRCDTRYSHRVPLEALCS